MKKYKRKFAVFPVLAIPSHTSETGRPKKYSDKSG